MIQQRIPENQSRPSKLYARSQSSSEDSIEISPSVLRLGGLKRQPSVGKILPPYSNGTNHHLNNGLNSDNHEKFTTTPTTFIRPKKSELIEVNDHRKFDSSKYVERENFPNQENIDNADKSNKTSPNLAGNKKLKRFESNAKMTFDTRIQKAKYFSSSIAVSSMLKEMKQNDQERRGSEPRFSSGENYLDTEVDDISRVVNSSETREKSNFHTEILNSHQVHRSQQSDHKDRGTDSAVKIDEDEVEWLQSKTGISREQAITWYLTKNRGAQQLTPTPGSDTVRGPSSGRFSDELKPSKKELSHLAKAEQLNDAPAKISPSFTSSNTRSTLERIFDTMTDTEDTSFRTTPNTAAKPPPVNKHTDLDIRIREPLTTKSLAMLKTSTSVHGSYSTARINGNKFTVEVESQQNDAHSLSSSVINNENVSSMDMVEVDDNRQEFYESFDKQVNLLMERGLSREDAFAVQMQLQSQNLEPNVTQSLVDDGRKYYMDTNESGESVYEDPRQQELDKLMAYGMTGEQAELFLQQLSSSQNTAPTATAHPHQHPLVTKVAIRPLQLQQAEEHSPEVDEDEPFDDYQQKMKRFMQMGYTQEQAELAISMQSQRPDRAAADTRRQSVPTHQGVIGNRAIPSNPTHTNGSISVQSKHLQLIDGSDTFDANDESEIAVLVARGFTRAEAIISIMAADEAEAINSVHQSLPPTTSSYASSILPVETGVPVNRQPMRHASIMGGDSFSRLPQHMPSHPHLYPVPGPYGFASYEDGFGSYRPLPSQLHPYIPVPPRPAHQPVPRPSINIGTYFKAENPDDEALELGILLSHQEAIFGENMFESLRAEDSVVVDSYITSGYTFNDAVLDVFERKNGFSRPAPRPRQRPVYNGYPAQVLHTYPGRGHYANQMSSGSSVATAPVAGNSNRRRSFIWASSASSVPGDYLRSRSNNAHGNHPRRGIAQPYLPPYPPPESAIDTHWRKGFKVENCKKSVVQRLMNMGFREEEAVQALLETNQNEKHAAQLLYANRAHYIMY